MIIPPEINMSKFLHPDDAKILDGIEALEKILYKTESEFNSIEVIENSIGRFLKFGETYQSGILNYYTCPENLPYMNYFLVSCLLNPDIKNILMLGLGSGYLANDFIRMLPDLKNIDIVEIDPSIIEIAHDYFDFEQNSKVNIHIQDARVFVRNSKSKYDLIVMDLFSKEGMSYRFMTEEFLAEVRARLTSKGLFTANLFGLMNFDENNYVFNSILKTYRSVYKDVLVFPTNYGNYKFYRQSFGLVHELSDLTNIILFASKTFLNVSKSQLVAKATNLKESCNSLIINDIDKYAEDILEYDINLDNSLGLKDEFEEDPLFNFDNLREYLYIDHVVNDQLGKINPVDDERSSSKSG